MNVLAVDDDRIALKLIKSSLQKWGHSVYTATNGSEAWDTVISTSVDIVISDWQMPGMDGLELCSKIRSACFKNYIYLILVSTFARQDDIVAGLESGVDDYLVKPFNWDELNARLKTAARIIQMERQLTGKYKEIKSNYFQTIQMFAGLVEHISKELGGHSRRVTQISVRMAQLHPDFPEKDMETIKTFGLLHDIGMIGLPNSLIAKMLNEMNYHEKELYKSHPVQGEQILRKIKFLRPISKLVRSHHEQVNGRGFPDGLAGEDIPLMVKIVSAASTYDNLVHKRKVLLKDIPDMLNLQKGYQLDSETVNLLFKVNAERITHKKEDNTVNIRLDDLTEGMILARNVRRSNGALILPKNTEMTRYEIDKLHNYYGLDKITGKLNIFKSSIKE